MKKYITKESKTRLLLLAALFFSCLFIFRQYLFGDSVLVFDDVGGDTWQQYTMYYADIVNHLRAGDFSFWDFTNGIGTNLFTMLQADPSLILICLIGVVLGPAHMLYYLVVLQILKIMAAGWIFYWFLSEFKYSRQSRFLASFAYGLNGYLLVWGQHYQFGMVVVYLPLILLFEEKFIRREKGHALFPVTVFLSGIYSVYLSYMTLIGAGFYLIFRLVMDAEDFKTGLRRLFSGCAQMVLGIGMSLGVFLPMAANIMNSSRVAPARGGLVEFLKKCFYPYKKISYYESLLIRPFSTNLQNLQTMGNSRYTGYKNYYEAPVLFCSTLAVIFLIQFLLLFWRSDAKRRVKAAVYTAAVLILACLIFPGGGIVFNAFTTPATNRYTYILIAVFLMVFAWMWDYLKAEGKISIVGLVITEVLMIRAYMAGYEDSIFREYRINAVLLAVTGSVMVLCVLTLGFCRKQAVRRVITGCLILMLGINVISEGGITYTDRICLKKTDTPEEQMDAQTVAFNERQQAEDEETAAGAMFDRPQTYYRELYSQDVQDALAYLKETDPEFYRVEKDYSAGTISMDSLAQNYRGISTYNSVMNGNIKEFVKTCYPEFCYLDRNRYTFWQMADDNVFGAFMGVRYFMSKNSELDSSKYELIGRFGKICLYRNKEEGSVARFYENTISEESLKKLCQKDVREKNRETLLENAIAVEGGKEIGDISELDAVSEAQENSEVTLNAPEKDSHVTGTVDAKADGYVMCMIPYEKGWTVTVDGEETEILKGDIGFLAFKVAEGEHQIELIYQVPGLRSGMIAGGVCWIVYLGLVAFTGYRRKRKAAVR